MLGMYGSAPILAGTALAVALITIGNFAKSNTRNINMIKSCHRANSLNNQSKRVHSKPIHLPIATLALSVSFALFIFFNTYYLTIGSMDSFVQYDDNATHLAMIESESQLGNYSTLKPAYNLPNDPNAICETAYYPSGFHTIPALSCTLTGANAAISENASAILYTCIAFPLGITSLCVPVLRQKLTCCCGNNSDVARLSCFPPAHAYSTCSLSKHCGFFPNSSVLHCVHLNVRLTRAEQTQVHGSSSFNYAVGRIRSSKCTHFRMCICLPLLSFKLHSTTYQAS